MPPIKMPNNRRMHTIQSFLTSSRRRVSGECGVCCETNCAICLEPLCPSTSDNHEAEYSIQLSCAADHTYHAVCLRNAIFKVPQGHDLRDRCPLCQRHLFADFDKLMLRYQHYVNRRVALKMVWPTLRAGMDGLNDSSPELCLNHSFEPQYKRPSEMAARRAAVLGVDAGTLLRDIPLYRATEAAWLHALVAALEGEADRYGKLLRAAQELDDYVVSLEVVLAMRRLEWELVHEDGGQCINGGNDDQEEDTETKEDL